MTHDHVIYEDVKRRNVPERALALHFENEEESRGGGRGGVGGGAALLRAEVNRDDATTGLIEMTDTLLTGRTQRRPLASLALADEHVRRAEPLPSHGRRRCRLPARRRPRPVAAPDPVERDVDRLATADGHPERTGARVGADRV